MKRLFFICQECQVEHYLRQTFGDNCYFATALGGTFGILNKEYWEDIEKFIERIKITNVYFVCDINCRFIEIAATEKKPSFDTRAEKYLFSVKKNNPTLYFSHDIHKKKEMLCSDNIKHSIKSWLKSSKVILKYLNNNDVILDALLIDNNRHKTLPVDDII